MKLVSPEDQVRYSARTRNLFDQEPLTKMVVVLPETFSAASGEGCDGDMHLINEICLKKLPHRRHSATDTDVFAVGGRFRELQCFERPRVYEMESRIAQRD